MINYNNITELSKEGDIFIDKCLGIIRNKNTPNDKFKENALFIGEETLKKATQNILTFDNIVDTPVPGCLAKHKAITPKKSVFVLPLRAAILGLTPKMQKLTEGTTHFIGIKRDEKANPVEYYPLDLGANTDPLTQAFVIDPMLASGGSINKVLEQLEQLGYKNLNVVSMFAAPEGIQAIQSKFPNAKITTTVIDQKLNDKKYIMPGCGDAGDRGFPTLNAFEEAFGSISTPQQFNAIMPEIKKHYYLEEKENGK